MSKTVAHLAAVAAALLIVVLEGDFPQAANSHESMTFPRENWQEASPESQGVDSAKLKAAIAYLDERSGRDGARQLVVIRNGRLIWKGPDSNTRVPIYSCTKTFTSTILGLLIDDGKCTLDTRAVEYKPNLDDQHSQNADIALRHLASMTGGYRGAMGKVAPESPWGDPTAYLTPVAPYSAPGATFQYNDHDVHLLGHILTRIAGEPLKDFFKRRIADPIGLRDWDWEACGIVNGVAHTNAAGTPWAQGAGVQIAAEQLARFGHLFLNRGNWNGKQLVSARWVDQATTNQAPVTLQWRNMDLRGRYGFYWWTNGVMVSGKRPWPSAPPRAYTAHGAGSNFCFVVPEWNMVVVRLAHAPKVRPRPSEINDRTWDAFFARMAEALGK
ncbi:serine hydrolase [Candidatus Sumerlaeota bacterium]|nr:serine hydrolase [Candidatus Sumerlaeota bacterium]